MIRSVITLIIYCVAYVISDLALFLSLIGCVFTTFQQNLVPVLLHMVHFGNRKQQQQRYIEYGMIILFSMVTLLVGPWY